MRTHDFYGLPRALQDRFIESSQGVSVPKPLLVAPESDGVATRWALGAGAALLAWAGFDSLGFGDLSSGLALGGPFHAAVNVAFAAVATLSALKSYAVSWEGSRTPFGSGAFLFPSGVLHARGRLLVEYDARDVRSVKVEGSELVVTYESRSFRFPAGDAERAAELCKAFEAGRESWSKLREDESLDRARLSPLVDSGVPNPLAPTEPHAHAVLFTVPVLVGVSLLAGATLGMAVSYWRTSLSEKALYRAAVEQNSVSSYESYLARGGDRPAVRDLLLPRAELEAARLAGGVPAIVEFQRRRAGSQIEGEVQAALRTALLVELESAKKQGQLAVLDALPKKYPEHAALIATELSLARRSVYLEALSSFTAEANPASKALVGLVERLLAHAEQHGPRVLVRFRHDFPQDPAMLDSIVSKSKKYYLGRKLLPTQYFVGAAARRREQALGERMVERLQRAFPADVLAFELAPLPAAENETLPPPDVPALTISHSEKLSGGFVGGMPKGMYMGAAATMKAELALPGDAAPVSFVHTVWRTPSFALLVERKQDIPDVYEDMMGGVFRDFGDKYLATWFAQP
jgi:hypothetical protein